MDLSAAALPCALRFAAALVSVRLDLRAVRLASKLVVSSFGFGTHSGSSVLFDAKETDRGPLRPPQCLHTVEDETERAFVFELEVSYGLFQILIWEPQYNLVVAEAPCLSHFWKTQKKDSSC